MPTAPKRSLNLHSRSLPTVLLALGFGALYLATIQGRLYGNDAAHFANWLAAGSVPARYHSPAYPQLAIAIAPWLRSFDPLAPLFVLSAVAGGVAVGFAHAFLRRLGIGAREAVFAAVFFGVTPVTWFFATTIETHALHVAAVTAAAWLTLRLSWRQPIRATVAVALALALVYDTHPTAPLLGPAFVLLAQFARSRDAQAFSLWQLAAVGTAMLAGLLVGHAANNAARGIGFVLQFGESTGAIGAFGGTGSLGNLLDTWLGPQFLLAPATAAAVVVSRPLLRLPQLAMLTAVAPALAFFLWWGVPERGAYLLGSLPFATALVARSFPLCTRRRQLTAVAIVLLQATGAAWSQHQFGLEFRIADRVARIAAEVGPAGLVLSGCDNAPDISLHRPGITEMNLAALALLRPDPERLASEVVSQVREALATRRVVLDLSYHRREGMRGLEHSILRVEAAIRAGFRVHELDDPSWPLLRIEAVR